MRRNYNLRSAMCFCILLAMVIDSLQLIDAKTANKTNNSTASFQNAKTNITSSIDGSTIATNKTNSAGGFVLRARDAIKDVIANAFTFFDDDEVQGEQEHRADPKKNPNLQINETVMTNVDIERLPTANLTTTSTTQSPKSIPKLPEAKNKKSNLTSTTTIKPARKITTREPETTTRPRVENNETSDLDSKRVSGSNSTSSDLLGLLIKSLYALGMIASTSGGLSRNIRVANESQNDSDVGRYQDRNAKLILVDPTQSNGQLPFRLDSQNVHLLCKLLHERLESITNSSTTTGSNSTGNNSKHETIFIPTSTSSTTTSTSTTTKKPYSVRPTITSKKPASSPKPEMDSPTNGVLSKDPLVVVNTWDLDEKNHENWLLESIVQCEPNGSSQVCSQQAQNLMLSVFKLGLAQMRLTLKPSESEKRIRKPTMRLSLREALDYDEPFDVNKRIQNKNIYDQPLDGNDQDELKIHLLNWSLYDGQSDKVSIVYWLLRKFELDNRQLIWRVLTFAEADELLDKLDNVIMDRLFLDVKLKPISILNAFSASTNGSTNVKPGQPKLPEEGIIIGPDAMEQPLTGLAWVANKLANSSFTDNLFLYLIILLILVFLIALCLSIPMLCQSACRSASGRRRTSSHNVRGLAPATTKSKSTKAHRVDNQQQHRDNINLNKSSDYYNDTVWRKLSNTTTTMVRDDHESVQIHKNGAQIQQLRAQNLIDPNRKSEQAEKKPFEWYTFEEAETFEEEKRRFPNGTAGNSVLVHKDKLQVRKSVQGTQQPSSRSSPSNLLIETLSASSRNPFDDDHQSRDYSNTLTKSELVMLKEKLIPIGIEGKRQASNTLNGHHRKHKSPNKANISATTPSRKQAASQTSDPLNMDSELELDLALGNNYKMMLNEPIYLNQSRELRRTPVQNDMTIADQNQSGLPVAPEMDTNSLKKRRRGNEERAASFYAATASTSGMTHKPSSVVDYSSKTQSQIAAIKAELALLEQMDREQSKEKEFNS